MNFYTSFKLSITWGDLFTMIKDLCFKSNTKEQNLNFFKKYINKKYIIDVPSSRWGLVFLLKSMNLPKYTEVILPAYTYFAVPAAVVRANLTPVFVDAGKDSVNIDEEKLEEVITNKTKVIIATHLCGFPCNMNKINQIAKKYSLIVIEDCAQSFGAMYNRQYVGSFSKAAYYSFSITKNLTMLRGGIVATDDERIAKYIRQETDKMLPFTKFHILKDCLKAFIIKFATSKIGTPFTCFIFLFCSLVRINIIKIIFKEKRILLGHKYPKYGRLNYSQKQLAKNQFKKFDKNNDIKENNGKLFYKLISMIKYCKHPLLLHNCKNIFSSMPVFVDNKKDVQYKLLKKLIDVSVPFVQCCPMMKEFKQYKKLEYPNALCAQEKLLYFLSSGELDRNDMKYIVNQL